MEYENLIKQKRVDLMNDIREEEAIFERKRRSILEEIDDQ